MTNRYHPPQTPCDRRIDADGLSVKVKDKLRLIITEPDPLKLLDQMRAVQDFLAALAMTAESPNLATFMTSLYSAWHDEDPPNVLDRGQAALSS